MQNHRIIAIETSGRAGSVAIAEGPRLIDEAAFATDQEHARDLLPLIDQLMRQHGWEPASIEHCYLSIGPGSFTGLRVAVTFARHLSLAVNVKICAVPTLDVIAMNAMDLAPPPKNLAVILDAKRGQVFGSIYHLENGAYHCTTGPKMIEPQSLLAGCEPGMAVVGEGVPYHEAALRTSGAFTLAENLWRPRAANVHKLGWRMACSGRFTPSNELVPLYVRRPEAEELWEKRLGTAALNKAQQ